MTLTALFYLELNFRSLLWDFRQCRWYYYQTQFFFIGNLIYYASAWVLWNSFRLNQGQDLRQVCAATTPHLCFLFNCTFFTFDYFFLLWRLHSLQWYPWGKLRWECTGDRSQLDSDLSSRTMTWCMNNDHRDCKLDTIGTCLQQEASIWSTLLNVSYSHHYYKLILLARLLVIGNKGIVK